MAIEQFGICSEPNLHGYYLLFNVMDDRDDEVRAIVASLPEVFDRFGDRFSESNVNCVVAIGASYWDDFFPQARPKGLAPFLGMENEDRIAPAVGYDIYVEVRSDRFDVNHIIASKVCEMFGDSVELVEQTRAFRFLDGRDLTGFVDGTENPQGRHRREVALVKADYDEQFQGGSYLHIQRYRHNLALWGTLKQKQQEDIFARTKMANVEYKSEEKPPTAHIKRVNLKDENGDSIEILRQSMPYGDMKTQGLFFVSYCREPEPFMQMLKAMIYADGHGHFDHMLKYTQAETGAAFFAPSRTLLASL
ncbi:Dyp-type peroxidase [Thalassotalea agarivorans]|uniref:Putative iron-dependent peroxidase n=1 Tax=Thalassotalea agarivorans TaxID=349064 RepID=A0A1H9YCK0_THASX|nr:Dyp-type peroxidase [Thalassotalea agarivorans]SES66584.1 putative iron-dependent peroxidase [Thalassotalea agarivorans]